MLSIPNFTEKFLHWSRLDIIYSGKIGETGRSDQTTSKISAAGGGEDTPLFQERRLIICNLRRTGEFVLGPIPHQPPKGYSPDTTQNQS